MQILLRRIAFVSCLLVATASAQKTVKVFVLAGQSNMEGKVQRILMDHQCKDEKTKRYFTDLYQGGKWVKRDDVFIKFLGKKGPLTIGYGSGDRTGVELQFGWEMGDHFDAPVLLIKAAWGGHSLVKLFRSPSAGMPSDEKFAKELADRIKRTQNQNKNRMKKFMEARKKNPDLKPPKAQPMPTMADITKDYGKSYRNMLKEVRETMANCGELFPQLEGHKLELTGFVWFQGWNDQYGGAENEYASNMEHFINDVRKDLGAPKLPFVIGVMGQNGSKPAKGAMKVIQDAQLAMPTRAEFKGNVKSVPTDVLIDKAAEKLYPNWRQNFEEWQKTGSDHGYHYLGSAIWHLRMGKAFATAMKDLLK